MKRRVKNSIAIIVSLCIFVCTLSGCNSNNNNKTESESVVRISMYNNVSFPAWRTFVENQCPDINIIWDNNYNSLSSLYYQAQNNSMDDIVAIREFDYDKAELLNPYLMDISYEKNTGDQQNIYKKDFIKDNKTYWVAQSGVIKTIMANESLFDYYKIELPNNLESFVNTCKEFEKVGIRGFMFDAQEDWGANTIFQSCSLDIFNNGNNSKQYNSKIIDTTDTEKMENVANRLIYLKDNNIIHRSDFTQNTAGKVNKDFYDGKVAMIIQTSDTKLDSTSMLENATAMPFFGKTENDSYLMSYPCFNLAVNKSVTSNSKKEENVKRVLDVMTCDTAQKVLSTQGEGLLSYKDNSIIYPSEALLSVDSYVKNKKIGIRFINSNSFNAADKMIENMFRYDSNGKNMIQTYNRVLTKKDDDELVGSIDKKIKNINTKEVFNAKVESKINSPLASVLAQTIKIQTNCDICIVDSDDVVSTLYKGDYSQSDVQSVIQNADIYTGRISYDELKEIVEKSIYSSVTYENSCLESLIDFPAFSGINIEATSDNVVNNIYDENKNELNRYTKFSVAIDANIYNSLMYSNSDVVKRFTRCCVNTQDIFTTYWKEKGILPKAQENYSLVKEQIQ